MNGAAPEPLTRLFRAEQASVRERLAERSLSEIPALAAWRGVFRRFDVDPTQYRSAAEALLRRLVKQGELPAIGTLVDLANLVSIRYALPIAVFDLHAVTAGRIVVRLARGDEPWSDLGASEATHPQRGEVIFVDAADVVVARRWCWRQSLASAAQPGTSEILVTVEGHHETAADDVERAVADLLSLLGAFALPAMVRTTRLDRGHPAIDWTGVGG
jgi:DNA/RNA-binding domain of Phe-tRNA-synthetase-like protein